MIVLTEAKNACGVTTGKVGNRRFFKGNKRPDKNDERSWCKPTEKNFQTNYS